MRMLTPRRLRIALCSAGVAAGLLGSTVPASAAVWRANVLSGPPYQHWYGLGPTPAAARANGISFCRTHAMRPATCHVLSITRVR
jgi:hypothetical protein